MEHVSLKYSIYTKASPPQPIRIAGADWAGAPEKMEDGSNPQPWHCLPFVEGSTYGMELLYPYDTECQVIAGNGPLRFEYDFTREPGGGLTGGEFVPFSPIQLGKYYLFNTGLDLEVPPGHVLRTEPHPRYFTDDTGTVPLALIANLQSEWFPRMLFVVFRAPPAGQRHVFRKGAPYAQILVVPHRIKVDITQMTPEENAQRRELEKAIAAARWEIADNTWRQPDGGAMSNHYKVLARAFARGGMAGVDDVVRRAAERHQASLPKVDSLAAGLELGARLIREHNYARAMATYTQVLAQDPNCAEALSNLGICCAAFLHKVKALDLMKRAVALEPKVAKFHSNLGEMLRRAGRFQEAEASIRSALTLCPNDPGTLSVLGLILAQQGRTAEGLQAYRAAVALGYPYPARHINMGAVLAEQKLYDEAQACFETALAIDPGSVPARQALEGLSKGRLP